MSYIEKEATITELRKLRERWGSTLTGRGVNGAIAVVEKMAAVDIAATSVPETKNETSAPAITTPIGYWEETESVTMSKTGRETRSTVYTCSLCQTTNGKRKSNYCSNCGADMRGEINENE